MGFGSFFASVGSALYNFARAAWTGIVSAAKTVVRAGRTLLVTAAETVGQALGAAWEGVKTIVGTIATAVQAVARKVGEFAPKVLQWAAMAAQGIKALWDILPKPIKDKIAESALRILRPLLAKFPLVYAVVEIILTVLGRVLHATYKTKYVREDEVAEGGQQHRTKESGELDLSMLPQEQIDHLIEQTGQQGMVLRLDDTATEMPSPA